MELVLAQCTQCGAKLEVDSSKETALCPSCKSAFVVEKAIHNYNYNVANNISDSVVNIYGGQDRDFIIRGGILEKYVGESTTPIIPNTVVEIGPKAFENTRITSIEIPDSVRVIQKDAFFKCNSLKTVRLLANLEKIESGTFQSCSSLESINIPDSVRGIEKNAFCGCGSLKAIHLPANLDWISEGTFHLCHSLESINIPDSLRVIPKYAFSECVSLKAIHLPANLFRIEERAFYNFLNYSSPSLESINIPDSVKEIGKEAFCNCSSLKEIHLPANLQDIKEKAFYNCSSLSEITIPSAEHIGEDAFGNCEKLTKLILPANLKRIISPIIRGSINITEIVILVNPKELTTYGNVFSNGNKDLKVTPHNTKSKPFYPNRPQKEGCYIATAVYGSYDCPELWTLRRFRDQKLSKSMPGRTSIKIYYTVSPTLVKIFGSNKCFTGFWKRFLDLFVEYLNQKGIKRDTYNDLY